MQEGVGDLTRERAQFVKPKTRVAILFGGKSAEHEISLRSAESILNALDPERFEAMPIRIDREGRWFFAPSAIPGTRGSNEEAVSLSPDTREIVSLDRKASIGPIDVVFPVLHGPYGEDGTIQGLLELAGLPYVGAGVLGSSVAMDKDVTKRLLRDAGLRIAPYRTYTSPEVAKEAFDSVQRELGEVLFVKPANLGSSVGIGRATNREGYLRCVEMGFAYDTKIVVESGINGREIECSVLGNDDPIASVLGEIRTTADFYSYEAKYLDESATELIIPARVDRETSERMRNSAVAAFVAVCCNGMARVDMFLEQTGEVVVNEINTIPGFTSISMYPKLWDASGIGYGELVTRLIDLALERHRGRSLLSTLREIDVDAKTHE